MNQNRRSPYLVLGVPYGTDPRAASAAFARCSKRARRDPDFPYDLDDLTWALHQIEHATADAAADLGTFRVPADPGALDAPSEGSEHFPSLPLLRRTPAPTDDDWQALQTYARAEAFDELVTLSAQNTAQRYRLHEHPPRLEQPTFVSAPRRGMFGARPDPAVQAPAVEAQHLEHVIADEASDSAAVAGWYADPTSRFELRYWDGSQWTGRVATQGQQYTDPPVAQLASSVAQNVSPVAQAVSRAAQDVSTGLAAAAGWYADPTSRFELRYWDGSQWTGHVATQGQQYTDPPVAQLASSVAQDVSQVAQDVSPGLAAVAGWYVDLAGRFELRYWDGSQWTERVATQGQQYTDPPVM